MNGLLYRALRFEMSATGGSPPIYLTDRELDWLASRYPRATRGQRATILIRASALAPILRLADAVLPRTGPSLDVGCGHGILTHWLARSSQRTIIGIDASMPRVRFAQASRLPPNASIAHRVFPDFLQGGSVRYAGFAFVDVLLYLSPAQQEESLRAARRASAPGARLIVKDSTTRPGWKYAYTRCEEAVKLRFRYYGRAGDRTLTYRSLREWDALFRRTGWRLIRTERLGRRTPYPGWLGVCVAAGPMLECARNDASQAEADQTLKRINKTSPS